MSIGGFSMNFHIYLVIAMDHRDLDNSVFVSLFPESCFVLIMYCTLSHMLGHMTSSANGKPYTIKRNKDFLIRLLKRGEADTYYFVLTNVFPPVCYEGELVEP